MIRPLPACRDHDRRIAELEQQAAEIKTLIDSVIALNVDSVKLVKSLSERIEVIERSRPWMEPYHR